MIMLKSFISRLPSCVTSFRLNFIKYLNYWIQLDFGEFCMKLQQNCPNVEELVLDNSELQNNNLLSVINLCTQYLQKVKKLVFHGCVFPADLSEGQELAASSKIEVLILSQCRIGRVKNPQLSKMLKCVIGPQFSRMPRRVTNPQFSRMPNLKVLCLYRTNADNTWFEGDLSFLNQLHVLNVGFTGVTAFSVIEKHGHNLKELYLCSVDLYHLNFNNSEFPHLETICFSCRYVTSEDVVSLIQLRPSLKNVYVNERVFESFTAHPFVIANRCKSEVVKAISEKHEHNLDYSYA